MWKDSTAGYLANGLKNTYALKKELLTGSYQIRPYQCFVVTDPKRREVMATQIRDRQFQRALCDEGLYQDLTRHFIYDNAACQRGKGVDFSLDRMEAHLRRYYRKYGSDGWVLKCDVHHYFASTSHEVAKAAVRKRVEDDGVYQAVCQIIDSFPGEVGIGLGSQVSQLIELAVLDDLDHRIKERLHIKHYLRYMDDFILVHPDKVYLQCCLEDIRSQLDLLGLELNKKTCIYPLKNGVKWLKWRFELTPTGKVLRHPEQTSLRRERKKLKNLKRLIDAGKVPQSAAIDSFQSWAAGMERRRSKRNRKKRLKGGVVREGPSGRAVERMRLYYKQLYGRDPYIKDK